MSFVHPTVAARRFLARHPSAYWVAVVVLAAGAAVAVHGEVRALRDARAGWATRAEVWVALSETEPGEPVRARRVEVPAALASPAAADDPRGGVARHRISAGEIITATDVGDLSGRLALVPDGWRAVSIVEAPRSAARRGDRVDVVSDGVTIAAAAIVVGHHDDVTLVAVPADAGPLVALAGSSAAITLLGIP